LEGANRIRILPEGIASQIAAGEVIDRPASVVRELLDNSIDAEADRIAIRIEGGGKRLIRVSDNGLGMSRQDLLLCIERHATSKIRDFSDLLSLRTLGFRGEALPSIGSVSRMQITSRPAHELAGNKLVVNAGKLLSIEETGAPPGTTVEVRDLFSCLPARRKFMKGVQTEADHIINQVASMAVPHLGIAFKLEDERKTILNLPSAADPQARLHALFGREVAEAMVAAQSDPGGCEIRLFLTPPDMSRARADRLLVYVNGRYVRDRLLTRALMEGYGQRLMKGRYPQAVVFLQMDPALVDVNVHPAKQEIRFQEGREVFQSVQSLVQRTLETKGYVVQADAAAPWRVDPSQAGQSQLRFAGESSVFYQAPSDPFYEPETARVEAGVASRGARIIGQLNRTYIVCETGEGLLLVDQHAAHERVVYESLKKAFTGGGIQSQAFLVPLTIELGLREAGVAERKLDQLARLGIEMEPFGRATFLLRGAPCLPNEVKWSEFVSDLLASLVEKDLEPPADGLDETLMKMACHGALRAGVSLTPIEMDQLLSQLEKTEIPTNCPHGRPVCRRFTYPDLEKMFGRLP
jgi:DNA mismatch repair protein MutL